MYEIIENMNAGIAAILGTLAGGACSYFVARLILTKTNFNEAAARFRSEFSEEIYLLNNEDADIYKILDEAVYAKHLKARIQFEPYLDKGKIKIFNQAWEKYFKYRNFEGQKIAPGSVTARNEERQKAINVLKDILFYAQPN